MLVYLNHALQQQKQSGTLNREKVANAVIKGTLHRVRPMMMTVAATITGLIPIMYGSGTGSIVMQRIAAPMVGGMISATILALMLIPAIFYLWHRDTH